ncbi:hypothetical protein B0H16DRAFT_1461592 [Mycena metata]|uniref:Uncharacterized protein n=1 Tax=Mycena metata TaxID=1033252 RepID=A0AAD7IRF5_9AGAR|nr:hypothetical protein B0H16DRAFT_1461592 [Mycena metata]
MSAAVELAYSGRSGEARTEQPVVLVGVLLPARGDAAAYGIMKRRSIWSRTELQCSEISNLKRKNREPILQNFAIRDWRKICRLNLNYKLQDNRRGYGVAPKLEHILIRLFKATTGTENRLAELSNDAKPCMSVSATTSLHWTKSEDDHDRRRCEYCRRIEKEKERKDANQSMMDADKELKRLPGRCSGKETYGSPRLVRDLE